MLRTSILQKSLQSCRYLINHKKPIVEMPSNKPPKYIYQVKYHPTAPPTFDQGYPDHDHQNPFDEVAMNDMETYRFKYSGQWWYIGALLPKLLITAFPIWVFYQMYTQSKRRALAGLQGVQSWNHIAEFPHQSKIRLPTF